eukprot:3574890-Pleurochrysis_carterae.AAC.1
MQREQEEARTRRWRVSQTARRRESRGGRIVDMHAVCDANGRHGANRHRRCRPSDLRMIVRRSVSLALTSVEALAFTSGACCCTPVPVAREHLASGNCPASAESSALQI